jgi:hypothetical protein
LLGACEYRPENVLRQFAGASVTATQQGLIEVTSLGRVATLSLVLDRQRAEDGNLPELSRTLLHVGSVLTQRAGETLGA